MAKYKMDDLVRAKFGGELWHILEAAEQTCEAGTQVTYLVKSYRKSGQGQWEVATKERRVREMEIGHVIDDIPSDLVIG